jgi:hypothetical protein
MVWKFQPPSGKDSQKRSATRHKNPQSRAEVFVFTRLMVSNHVGRQLDGSRSPFDQLAEIVDAVGDRIDVICDGGITRGTHVLKALSVGAKACLPVQEGLDGSAVYFVCGGPGN